MPGDAKRLAMLAEKGLHDETLHRASWKDNVKLDALLQDLESKGVIENVADLSESQRRGVAAMSALKEWRLCLLSEQRLQEERVWKRCSTEQWLDENEREWMAMDKLCGSRPWALKKPKPLPYPFREATNRMRKIEGPWLGDDEYCKLAETRGEAPGDVVFNLRPVKEHPASGRVLLFTPEFGSERSFFESTWWTLTPETCDIWVISWQGWSDWGKMIEYIYRKVVSFADGVSTVWYGHSMGAIVAYEVLKRFEGKELPNLPVAFLVSGAAAPDVMAKSLAESAQKQYSWLQKCKTKEDLASLSVEDLEDFTKQFGIGSHIADSSADGVIVDKLIWLWGSKATRTACKNQKPVNDIPKVTELTDAQRSCIIGDLGVMKSYSFKHDSKRLLIPVVAFDHDEDPLVDPEQVARWKEFAPESEGSFEHVHLEEEADPEVLADQGHGYAMNPVPIMLKYISDVADKYKLKKGDDVFPDIGPTDGSLPEKVDVVVVGAGIAGVANAKVHKDHGKSVCIIDKYPAIGGIWKFYANKYSRVNSSEPAYRLWNQTGATARPNEDHSPTHDIMRDIHALAASSNKGDYRLNWEVKGVDKQPDSTYIVRSARTKSPACATQKRCANTKTSEETKVHAKAVCMHVNRRIGARRDVTWPGRNYFRGEEQYGYANEVSELKFWGKRVIVVGSGAFAYENLRTAVEHGAKHVSILGRRAGTTCPKWIDMIAFLRPLDLFFRTNKAGNMISFEVWKQCYEDAGLPTPACWEEGLLKPHNHTVSVSDLAFIGGYYGLCSLLVGEIDHYRKDGQGVILKDGRSLDVDIIIKATGFHINTDVPNLTGYPKSYSWGSLDKNLVYGAEPLLDGGQFGSQKGKVELKASEEEQDVNEKGFEELLEKTKLLQGDPVLPVVWGPWGNPFGSAYVGSMNVQARFNAFLVANPEIQDALLSCAGKGELDTVETWASGFGDCFVLELKKILRSFGQ